MIRYKRSTELDAHDLELIQMLAEGHTVKTISADRGISTAKLNYQVRKIFAVLGACRTPNMIHIAWQRGILKTSQPSAK